MSASLKSSQDFIRALKSPSDPPHPDGPFKIQIASQAWDETSFYVPNKDQVIADWLLTRLLKEKSNSRDGNPVLNVDHWLLLANVIDPVKRDSRPIKVWLAPLINRTPIIPVVIAVFHLITSASHADKASLLVHFSRCFKSLWPLATQKANPDTLLDCFGAFLGLLGTELDQVNCESEEYLAILGPMIISSYRNAFFNSTNKKKLYNSFATNYLEIWLLCISPASSTTEHLPFISDAYDAGVETLFCIDTLRQFTEPSSDNNLFDILAKNSSSLVFPALPRLFLSFSSYVKKSRIILFGQKHGSNPASSLDQFRVTGMRFYASCDSLLKTREGSHSNIWKTITALLEIVNRENLYNASHAEYDHLLKETCDLAVTGLQGSSSDADHSELLFQTICALTTIEYEIVAASIPLILPVLAKTSGAASSSTFLGLLLDFHAKTRTVPAHLLDLLDALTPERLSVGDARQDYEIVFAGPLFDFAYLDRLRKSISSFVTPGQCPDLVDNTANILKRVWEMFRDIYRKSEADMGDGVRKKQKLDAGSDQAKGSLAMASSEEIAAVSFAFLCRVVSVIWTSIPLNSVEDDVKARIRDSVNNFRETVISPVLSGFKKISKSSGRSGIDTWSWEVIESAVIRLQYSLTSSKRLGVEIVRDEKVETRMVKSLRSDEALPELKVEIIRFFFNEASKKRYSQFASIFDLVLEEIQILVQTETVQWKGRSSALVRGQHGKEQAALALLHILIDRWLPTIEEMATTQQLERFIKTLFHAGNTPLSGGYSTDALTFNAVYIRALRSAEFWELQNTRNAVLSYWSNETSSLDQIELPDLLAGLERSKPALLKINVDVGKIMTVYNTSLFAPLEYSSKHVRNLLLRRGLTADVILTSLSLANRADGDLLQKRVNLRVFLSRVMSFTNSLEYAGIYEMTTYFMNSLWIATNEDRLVDITLRLIEGHLSALVRSKDKERLKKIVERLITLGAFKPSARQFDQMVVIQFLDVITKSSSDIRDCQGVFELLRTLASSLADQLGKRLLEMTSEGGDFIQNIDANLLLMKAWCRTLTLRTWLQIHDDITQFGTTIARKISSLEKLTLERKSMIDACKSSISVLVVELQCHSTLDRAHRLKVIVATYVLLYQLSDEADVNKLDSGTVVAWNGLSQEDFSFVLDVSKEWLSAPETTLQELGPLVRFASTLLREAPEGTTKISQRYITTLLHLILNRSVFWNGPTSLRLGVLAFISGVCCNRPASFRSGDVPCIWTILSKLLVGSVTHDQTTSKEIFHELVTIISALIRLRRDLVVPTLPHLQMILRQLMMTIRGMRPQLGGKQSKMVADTFPSWINPRQPLTAVDMRALARLLEALTTKTVVRVYGTTSDLQKAESLARPFGKHASYVLVAYIEAMNDPLCVISAEVRKELYPGLFALCEMVSDSDREALMLSALDAGGRTIMKTLWKEYEKERYVGKG